MNKQTATRITPDNITELKPGEIFVFGSNLAGRHGKGAALTAREKYGAKYGQAEGLQGFSYAIPTKDGRRDSDPYVKRTLPLVTIQQSVNSFIDYAKTHKQIIFLVTPIGCNHAGYKPEQIAPLFKDAITITNIHLPQSFWRILSNDTVQINP